MARLYVEPQNVSMWATDRAGIVETRHGTSLRGNPKHLHVGNQPCGNSVETFHETSLRRNPKRFHVGNQSTRELYRRAMARLYVETGTQPVRDSEIIIINPFDLRF